MKALSKLIFNLTVHFQVKLTRDVRPNDGFIKQLAELDKSIRKC